METRTANVDTTLREHFANNSTVQNFLSPQWFLHPGSSALASREFQEFLKARKEYRRVLRATFQQTDLE